MRMGNDGTVQAFRCPDIATFRPEMRRRLPEHVKSASAPYTLVDVPDGQGGTRKMPLTWRHRLFAKVR